jgi:hypothetical protein
MDKLIFSEMPMVTIATNKFVRVPVILQYEDTPLISLVKNVKAGFTSSIPIYHSDGTYLARVVGSQIHRTKEGEKAGLDMKYPLHRTVCMMNNRVLFEIYREEAAAVRTTAELFTPDGYFVKITEDANGLFNSQAIQVGGVTLMGNTFLNLRIGIWYRSDGSVAIGVS